MKLSAVAAAVALSLPLTAFADITSSAQVANFRFEVIDLDLNDGIAAALTLEDEGKVLMAGYYANDNTPADPLDILTDDGTASAAIANGSASAKLLAGTANVAATFGGTQGEMFATVGIGHSFTLTANTKVILYADGAVAGGAGPLQSGISNSLLFATYFDAQGNDPVQVEDFLISSLGETKSGTLSVTFSSGADGLEGELGYGASAYASISPVPEPSSAAMLALGLAGLGFGWRRAKRK